jgi:hypothetical protein
VNRHCFVLLVTLTAASTTSSAFGQAVPSPVAGQPAPKKSRRGSTRLPRSRDRNPQNAPTRTPRDVNASVVDQCSPAKLCNLTPAEIRRRRPALPDSPAMSVRLPT